MSENIFSITVYNVADKISALSGMMMSVGTGDVIELDASEVAAIGSILSGIRDDLREWNHKERNLDHSLLDAPDVHSFLGELLRRAKSHRKDKEVQLLLLNALEQIRETNPEIQTA